MRSCHRLVSFGNQKWRSADAGDCNIPVHAFATSDRSRPTRAYEDELAEHSAKREFDQIVELSRREAFDRIGRAIVDLHFARILNDHTAGKDHIIAETAADF